MSNIVRVRINRRIFGYKFGNSFIAVKEYFDTAAKLERKIGILEAIETGGSEEEERKQKSLDALCKRLKKCQERQWKPLTSFVVELPGDPKSIESYIRECIAQRIESSRSGAA